MSSSSKPNGPVPQPGAPFYSLSVARLVRLIQAFYFLYALALPAVHLCALLALWLAPLSRARCAALFVACEVFNAWSAIDVFVLAVRARARRARARARR